MLLKIVNHESIWIAEFLPATTRLTLAIKEEFKHELFPIVSTPDAKLIINLDAIAFIDSSAIGSLLYLIKEIERRGGKLILCNCSPLIMDLFRMLHLVFLDDSDRSLKEAETLISKA